MLSKVVDEQIALTKKGVLSPNTIKRTYTDLKHFLQWCIEEGYITQMPRFPKVNGVASSRPHFDAKDWAKLARQLREIVKVENGAIKRDRMMLRDYVLILANTGIRVGEARTLKWRDVIEGKQPRAAWAWMDEAGAYFLPIKYGRQPIELKKGMFSIQCPDLDHVEDVPYRLG